MVWHNIEKKTQWLVDPIQDKREVEREYVRCQDSWLVIVRINLVTPFYLHRTQH